MTEPDRRRHGRRPQRPLGSGTEPDRRRHGRRPQRPLGSGTEPDRRGASRHVSVLWAAGTGRLAALLLCALALSACGEKKENVQPLPSAEVVDAGKPREAVAHLDKATGTVTLERDGKKGPAELGYLYVKDAVETGADSEAHVRFHGDRVVELGPDGRLVITEQETGLVLQVDKGLVLTRVPAQPSEGKDNLAGGVGLSILTPFGITRVGNASEVKVNIGKEGASVDVLVGSVELLSRNGQSTQAGEGDKLSLTAGAVEFVSRGKKEIELAPIEVVLSAVSGKAELKKKDAKTFKPTGKKALAVESGDTIRVKDGRATLAMNGSDSKVQLNKGAEFVFDSSGRGIGMEETSGDLKKGLVSLNLKAGTRSRVKLGALSLESDKGGQYTVQKTQDGYDVASLAGDATLTREGGEETKLSAGQRVRLGAKGAKVEEAERADLVIPSKSGLKVFHPGVGVAALTWEGGKADYAVTVASDSAFKDPVLAGLVHDDWVNVPVPTRGVLFWKVNGPDGKDVDHGSASFAPEAQQKDLARQRNEVPEGTETTTIYFQDKPPAVTFTFGARDNAAQYRVTVYRAADLSKPAAERIVSQVSAPFEAGVLSEGSYRWSVTPLLKGGQEGEGGRMNKLDIVYDNSVPQVVVKSPRNGDKVSGKQVAISGVAPVGAKVYINGKPAPLDDKNRFEGSATPIGRTPIVVFRMTRPSEPDVYTVRVLRRGR